MLKGPWLPGSAARTMNIAIRLRRHRRFSAGFLVVDSNPEPVLK
jgi:hypothetical protein